MLHRLLYRLRQASILLLCFDFVIVSVEHDDDVSHAVSVTFPLTFGLDCLLQSPSLV